MKKVIWITGASSGFGRAVAENLLKYTSHIVCISARRADKLNALESQGAFIYPLDVTDAPKVHATAENIILEHGRIDAVLVNAGFGLYGAIEDVSKSDMVSQFDVNVFGAVETVKAVLPNMRENKHGRIVMTGSTAAHTSSKGMGYYSATKHALRAVGTSLRQEVKSFGIDVVMIEPGIVQTDFKESAMKYHYIDDESSPYYSMAQELKQFMLKAFMKAPDLVSTTDIMTYALLSEKVKPVYEMDLKSKIQNKLVHLAPLEIYDKIVSSVIKRY